MDKETKDHLNWFLDFAYTDTDRISISELSKLATEINLLALKGVLSKNFIEGYLSFPQPKLLSAFSLPSSLPC